MCDRVKKNAFAGVVLLTFILLQSFTAYSYDKNNVVHCIGNAHIDTAWLWPKTETREEVIPDTYESVLNLMSSNPDFYFSTAGSIHYQWTKELYPTIYEDIQSRVVNSGQWEITGGQVVEPDTNITGGESHVRQFLYGKRFFMDEFGKDIRIGFLPDCFGFTWSWPQILKKSGVDFWLTAKLRLNDTNEPHWGPFLWKGVDGTPVASYMLTQGYGASIESAEYLATILDTVGAMDLKEGMHLYGTGDHGGGPTQAMLNNIDSINRTAAFEVRMGTVQDYYYGYLKDHLDKLPVIEDELYFEYHRGVYTSQASTKWGNRTSEIRAEEAEKLSAIFQWMGGEYPYDEITDIWKNVILVNQFHDILPGTSIGSVYKGPDIDGGTDAQYATAISKLETLIEFANLNIANNLDTSGTGTPLVVVNPLSFARKDVVEAQVTFDPEPPGVRVYDNGVEIPSQVLDINGNTVSFLFVADNVPALGAKVFHVRPEAAGSYATGLSIGSNVVENPYFRVTLNPSTGHISSLHDKLNSKEAFSGEGNVLHFFVDDPSKWDAWNLGDEVRYDEYTAINAVDGIEVVESGPIRAIYKVTKHYSNSDFAQYITLYSDIDNRVEIRMEANWNENQKLLKVAFPINVSGTQSGSNTDTIATYEIPYAAIARSIKRDTLIEQARFEVSGHRWADLSEEDANYGVSILNNCKYGWDALDNRLRLTLLKAATYPDNAADDGFHEMTYAVYPHSGDWRAAKTVLRGYELNYPLIPVVTDIHSGVFGTSFSFASSDASNIVISAIKRAEDDPNALIMRLYEAEGRDSTDATISLAENIQNAYEMDLIEWNDIQSDISYSANQFSLTMGKFDIRTVRLELTPAQGTKDPLPQPIEIDRTDEGGIITAQYTDSPSGEEKEKAFDNQLGTKYLTFHASGWLQFQFYNDNQYVISRYTITSANDTPERDPMDWTLYGSNDGLNWTDLDSRTNEDFPSRFLKRRFDFTNSTAYNYYRLDMTNNAPDNGVDKLQVAEIELIDTGAGNNPDTETSCNNGIDDDNDNLVDCSDPDCDGVVIASSSCGLGACGNTGNFICEGEALVDTCDPYDVATAETCDGIDNDCDGEVDEGLGQTTCGVGACEVTVYNCVDGVPRTQTCEPGDPLSTVDTTCNGVDDDCSGEADEDYVVADTCGVGDCRTNSSPSRCVGGVETACIPGSPASEICDSLDNNCNGATDEDPVASAACDNGDFCDGIEVCSAGVCRAGADPCPDDGQFCNGAETCAGGACQSGGDPCPGQYCSEDTAACEAVECLGDEDCDDGNACTVDTCAGGVCRNDCESTVVLYPYTEHFESGWGDWVNESGDDIDWTRNSGSTPSSSTGPSGARGGAYYIYTEASSPNYPDKTALLVGPCFDLSDTIDAELTFWYHMYGSNMGSLNVEVSEDCATWTNVWSLSGNQGNTWYAANVDLSLYSGKTITIRFRGVTGSSYRSDLAIDDIAVTVTPAEPCTDDSDCDDGVFCNGVETCSADGFCRAGGDPCPGKSCDEGNDACVAGPVFEYDFESGNAPGWDPYGADSTASTGNWEMGDPNGTISGSAQAQPEDAYEGAGCAFTAQNSSLGSNDVDRGVVYLVSPVIDLSGADSADLEFVRWFYNRDTGEDSGDFFVAEVSNDNGATWVNLETLDTNQSANTWTERSFSLGNGNYIDLTGTVRVRFGAADGSSTGNIIEAAVDNVKVWAHGGCEQDSDCDDGLFCNGLESCAGGVCRAGSDPCPGQLCDENSNGCVECLIDGDCDDGSFCNGAETCDGGTCRVGTTVNCDDGLGCTDDSCNEGADSCDNIPVDGNCDDGLFCNGGETCDAGLGCLPGGDPCPGQGCDEATDICTDCFQDADCNDGLYCNGNEICEGGLCRVGSDPCAGQLCDEDGDQCLSGPSARLEAGSVTVGPAAVTVTVDLSNTYISPVVVCSVQYSNNSTPVVPRVLNVTTDSFDVYLQNPSDGSVSAENVSYLVMEEGVWTIDGVNVEAQKYLSTVTDENNSWVGSAQIYGQSYTSPVVIGQVMSANDPDWSLFWCQGSSRNTPPSSSALKTGKTVCEDTDTTRADETVGFIVFETGHGTLGGVEFEAHVGADTVRGVTDSPPYAYTFNTAFGSAPTVALTTMAGVDGGNGGWSYSHGPALATTKTLNLSIDEDQVGDSERNHTTEQVGYVVFETDLVYP